MSSLVPACPLCFDSSASPFCSGSAWPTQGDFYLCKNCDGVFKNPKAQLSEEQEKHRYDLHNNSLEDAGYLQYLNKSWQGFLQHTPQNILSFTSSVLDYGCGPVKALEHILRDTEFRVSSWDKYYFPENLFHSHDTSDSLSTSPPQTTFDILFCHEVVEHFTRAAQDFERLISLTHTGSLLFIRTEFYPLSFQDFKAWYYKNDPTHVFFYQRKSFEHLASKHNLKIIDVFDNNKCILQVL